MAKRTWFRETLCDGCMQASQGKLLSRIFPYFLFSFLFNSRSKSEWAKKK